MSEPVLLVRARRLRAARGVVVAIFPASARAALVLAGTVVVASWRDGSRVSA